MQAGFPNKPRIIERGNSINYGGDYRYRYDLCPRARTVVVYDTNADIGTFTPLSLAGDSRLTTIYLTGGATYISILYRSKALEVWVFGTTNVIVIDADPTSGTFNTIKSTITTTVFNAITNGVVQYSEIQDKFYFSGIEFNPLTQTSISIANLAFGAPFFCTNGAYFPSFGGVINGGSNGECTYIIETVRNTIFEVLGFTATTFEYYIIKGKRYSGSGSVYRRFSDDSKIEASLSITSSPRGAAAYDPETKVMIITNFNGLSLPVVTISPFANVGNLQTGISSILATNQILNGTIVYSPYSKKIYIKSGGPANTAGIDRIFIIDTTQSIANMVCGYRTIDEGSHISGALYNNQHVCFNGLKINEYE